MNAGPPYHQPSTHSVQSWQSLDRFLQRGRGTRNSSGIADITHRKELSRRHPLLLFMSISSSICVSICLFYDSLLSPTRDFHASGLRIFFSRILLAKQKENILLVATTNRRKQQKRNFQIVRTYHSRSRRFL